jgi:hypothetical protein
MIGTFTWSSGLAGTRTYRRIWICENPIVDNGVNGIGYPDGGLQYNRILLDEPITVLSDEVLDLTYTHYADGREPEIYAEIVKGEDAEIIELTSPPARTITLPELKS